MSHRFSNVLGTLRRLPVPVVLVLAVGWSCAVPARAVGVGSPSRAGDAVPVDPINQSKDLTHGDSDTKFSLRLPAGAACPGDSANDQWRVQSFLIPATDDPGAIHYGVIGPEGTTQFALYQVNTRPFTDTFTQPNSAPGHAGSIPAIAELSFAVFPPGTLPDGTYRVGIACTYFRETAMFWDTEIVIESSSKPGHLTWRLTNAPEAAGDSGGSFPWVLAVGVVLIAAAATVVFRRLRHTADERSRTHLSKEPQ